MLGSLQQRNDEIARLKATVDELTVRERSLMNELRRVMAEQVQIEAAERQRRMDALKATDPSEEDDENISTSDKGFGFASSVEISEDEPEYDEVTYYEEETIQE